MQVTICGPNLNDQSKGQFHIHAAGCADLVRHANREPEYRHGWTIEADSQNAVGDEIYSDHIAEGSMQPGDGTDDCHFFPCCSDLPLESEALTQTFELRLTTGNAAMQSASDIADALRDVAAKLYGGTTGGKVRDANGNSVGEFYLSHPE